MLDLFTEAGRSLFKKLECENLRIGETFEVLYSGGRYICKKLDYMW